MKALFISGYILVSLQARINSLEVCKAHHACKVFISVREKYNIFLYDKNKYMTPIINVLYANY